MLSIIVCIILGLNLVLGEEIDLRSAGLRQDARDAIRIWQGPGAPGGSWGGPGGPSGPGGPGKPPGQGWGVPPFPEPIENDVLGVEKMFRSAYPLPASSVIDIVNVTTYYDHSVCSPESVVKDLLINGSFPFPITCNGITSHVIPWTYTANIKGGHGGPWGAPEGSWGAPEGQETQSVPLVIPKLYKLLAWLNGNFIDVATGGITSPPQCVGSFYWKVIFYAANSQYECSSTGLTGHTMVYSVKVITGPCLSVCWLEKGYTKLSPAVNDLGSLATLGNN